MTSRVQKIAPPALDPEHFRRLAHDTVDLVADYLAGIRTRPVFQPMTPAERATLMQEPLGAAGIGPEVLLERVRAAVLPHAMGNGHPRFFGWVNSAPAPVGVLADFLAAALNPSCAGGDHAAIYVERAAVRWLMELIGFPTEDVVRETGARLASTGPSIPPEHGKEQEQGGDQKEAARDGA